MPPPKKYPKHLSPRVPGNSESLALTSETVETMKKPKQTECSNNRIRSTVDKKRKTYENRSLLSGKRNAIDQAADVDDKEEEEEEEEEEELDEEKLREIEAEKEFKKDTALRQKAFDDSIERLSQLCDNRNNSIRSDISDSTDLNSSHNSDLSSTSGNSNDPHDVVTLSSRSCKYEDIIIGLNRLYISFTHF